MIAIGTLWKFRGFIGAGLLAAFALLVFAYVKHLEHEVAAKTQALREAAHALTVASGEIKARDGIITENAKHEAHDATDTSAFWKGQAAAAFRAGYASRRCVGPQPDGMRNDLRDAWEDGAIRGDQPAADLPGKPHG